MSHRIWIRHGTEHPGGNVNLICFPYAGGSPGIFASWRKEFRTDVNLCPVLYPGRDLRMEEPVSEHIEDLADVFVTENRELFERPFAVVGYCAGGLYAYETILRVKDLYGTAPLFFLSISFATPAFRMTTDALGITTEDTSYVEYLLNHHIIGEEAAEDEAFLEYYLPIIKGDFRAIDGYPFGEKAPMECDVYALFGSKDPLFSPADIEKWQDFTKGGLEVKLINGGHYCMEENKDAIISLIYKHLGRTL